MNTTKEKGYLVIQEDTAKLLDKKVYTVYKDALERAQEIGGIVTNTTWWDKHRND